MINENMTKENDVVIIYSEDAPVFFARIEDISPDIKQDWYNVKLLILKVPLQTVTWTLRDSYIDGAEFIMDGQKIRMEQVVCPDKPKTQNTPGISPQKQNGSGTSNVIFLADLKKK